MDRDLTALDSLQDQLLKHFQSLATTRQSSGFPIFALEHCLNSEQLKQTRKLLRIRIQKRLRLEPHWLLWAVYASEAGYDYKGDEYWPSFEQQTPNWQYHDRPRVKRWFQKFQKTFNGVEPSGPWAEHFSIIAWPITHALLPLYLQRQFVKLLYDLRYRLPSTPLNADSIGRLLAAHASHASTRFQAFLEQEELTGQIAAALLRGDSGEADLIHPPTLTRIVADLEDVRSSREWLKETRRVVSDRFKGIGRGRFRPRSPITSAHPDKPVLPDTSRFVIRPDLFLRHAGDGRWSAILRLKSLRPIAAESAELRMFLDCTRCRLNGATDWKPTGWLLSGNPIGALRRWPKSGEPLVQFEHPNSLMDHLLETEYRLKRGPLWLFRIGREDGIARHIASPVVRPGNDYVVVTTSGIPSDLPGLAPCRLECESVQAFRLAVPSQVEADATARLLELGIDVARTIRVWPAGLPGRGWDGDGSTEWLTTESPCLGISPDHPLDALSFRLNNGSEQVLATEPLGSPTFVRLPPLPAGTHTLTVKAHRSSELEDAVEIPPAEGFARLAVREPEPWTPGLASHPGLIVTQDPFDASLDTLWRNELRLSVNGPEGFTVRIHLELQTADDRRILSDPVSDSMQLPITPDAWRGTFAKFLEVEDRAWKYLEAATCTLEIIGGTLGTCALRFDHKPSPLRWSLKSKKGQTIVRLIDDTGLHEDTLDIQCFTMERPLEGIPLDAEDARMERVVEPPGGLYLARYPSFEDAAVVSAPSAHKLVDLGVEPNVHVAAGLPAVRQAFDLLRLWHNARQAGLLVEFRRRQVTQCIFNAIFDSICGANWVRAEEDFAERPSSPKSLEALQKLVDRHTRFGHRLVKQGDLGDSDDAATAQFIAEAERLLVSQDQDLCHFALRFADCRDDVLTDPLINDSVAQLVENPALLRGARLMSLIRKHQLDGRAP